jgi:DNA polymerase III epsilon subunit-like protein
MSYVVLDTESSVRLDTGLRVMVSLAYAALEPGAGDPQDLRYEIVKRPPDVPLDPQSESIHCIDRRTMLAQGAPLGDVIRRFLAFLTQHRPRALVGHDVTGDVDLLVTEALLCGLPSAALTPLRRLICTKQLAAARCAIPLAPHLREAHPCDGMVRLLGGHLDAPPPGGSGSGSGCLKWPNLHECYGSLVREKNGPTGPRHPEHDARGDVQRCSSVFRALLSEQRGGQPVARPAKVTALCQK